MQRGREAARLRAAVRDIRKSIADPADSAVPAVLFLRRRSFRIIRYRDRDHIKPDTCAEGVDFFLVHIEVRTPADPLLFGGSYSLQSVAALLPGFPGFYFDKEQSPVLLRDDVDLRLPGPEVSLQDPDFARRQILCRQILHLFSGLSQVFSGQAPNTSRHSCTILVIKDLLWIGHGPCSRIAFMCSLVP